ncbi:MAG: site-specific DNA-methyltransferase [Chloroflexota bacterium]|nr:site-specific DNA-methyltransferase [Chloroflexota bacterium]
MIERNFASGTIWTRDCIEVMRGMNSETVDLIYLDPPFNSKQDYAAPIGSQAAGAAFKDTWSLSDIDVEWIDLIERRNPALQRVLLAAMTDSDKSYLAYMAARLLEMPRLLKPTGSIYLHCDPTMSHYLKLVMDAIFGRENFRNEITWQRSEAHNTAERYGNVADILLYYTRSERATWNPVHTSYSPEQMGRFRHTDADGRHYKLDDLTAPRPDSDSGKFAWRGVTPPDARLGISPRAIGGMVGRGSDTHETRRQTSNGRSQAVHRRDAGQAAAECLD